MSHSNSSNSSSSVQSGASSLLLAGACACFADAATYPVDTVKVRLQTAAGAGVGVWTTVRSIAAKEGARSFYGGLAAGLQRQFAFASIRIGFYEPTKQLYVRRLGVDVEDSRAALMGVRLLAGVTTGGLAVCCAQPTDVVKVRMQSGGGRFAGCLAAYVGIFKAEGASGLWRGLLPNVARNGVVNCAEVVSYDTIKTYLVSGLQLADGVFVHFGAGLGSGFVATVVASPVDVVKTRMMSSSGGGVLSVARELRRQSGLSGFYKGFLPSFVRIAGWNILMFVSYEQAKLAWAELRLPEAERRPLGQRMPGKQLL